MIHNISIQKSENYNFLIPKAILTVNYVPPAKISTEDSKNDA